MTAKYLLKIQPALGLSLLICGLVFTSCGSKSREAHDQSANSAPSPEATNKQGSTNQPSTSPVVQTLPQLIKTADLSLKVKSIEPALFAIRNLVKQTKGDIYKFEDHQPNDVKNHHQVSMEIKVPQTQLDESIASISKLGTITNQTVKAEDVTNQLVDIDARLKNLRQEETMISKIMERAGSVKDILSVSKELSRVRSEIEEIDATQKSLRGRVAYSTINLQLEESVATIKDSGNPIGVRAGETWNSSTHFVGETATNLVLLLIGLIPFIPLFGLAGGAFYLYRRIKPKVKPEAKPNLDPIKPS